MSIAAYHQQIEAARVAALGMTRTQAEAFRKLLEQYAEELATRVSAGLATGDQRRALAISREIIEQLTRDLAVATKNGVVITSERVAQIYGRATTQLVAGEGGQLATGVLGGIGARAAQAVMARPELAATFRSIPRDSIKAVDAILHRALLRGASSTQLSRELRLHILGADAFPPSALVDRRRIGYQVLRAMGYEPTPENLLVVRKEAGRISDRAQLIARTEPMNAEWEVHRQGAIESSVVKAIRWRTSRRHAVPDECDVLAGEDLFGLGAGVYDPRVLPRRPHPRCICLQLDILLDPEEWGKERGPVPSLAVDLDEVARRYELRPSQERSLRSVLGAAETPPPAIPMPPEIKVKPTLSPEQLTKRELRKQIRAREREIAPLKTEWATVWDPTTGQRLLNKTSNAPTYVQFDPHELPLVKGGIFTHNHPSSSSFSEADVGFAIAHDVAEMRATGMKYDHSIVRPEGGWPDRVKVLALQQEVETRIMNKKASHGGVITEDWWKRSWHRMWREVFQKSGIPYARVKHKP